MGGTRKQAYLLKSSEAYVKFVGSSDQSTYSEPTVLYTPTQHAFKCFPDEKYDNEHISTVSHALREAANLGEGKIVMFGKFDSFYDIPRIYTRLTLPQQFVKNVSNVLAEARISIRGTYRMAEKCRNAVPSSSALIRDFERNGTKVIWKLVPGDVNEEFSVDGMSLKTQATYKNFQGIGKMAESYKSSGMTSVQLNYSVILEWVDFTLDFDWMERKAFGKLYADKPFPDCIIVDSNKKEFECHRCILAVNSDVLFTALGNGMEESQTHRIEMDDVGGEAVELLLKFMYAREDFLTYLERKSEQVVLELLKSSHKYNISELEQFLCKYLCRNSADWFSIDGTLAFYVFTVNVDSLENLTEKLWSFMRENSHKISDSTTYQEWLEKEPKVAAQFVLKLLESVQEQKNAMEVEIAVEEEEEPETILLGSDLDSDDDDEAMIIASLITQNDFIQGQEDLPN